MKKKWIVIALAVYAIVLAGCKVVSEPEPIAVESVTLDATTLTLAPGDTRKLTATVKPDNADDKTVKWSSSNTTVAMVNSDGTVGAIKAGTAIITAQAGGKSATCQITVKVDTVNPESVAVENVTLDAETLVLAYGEKATLTATVTPDNANDKTVKWSSSNTTVATVGEDGTVTAVKEGTTTITAQAGDETAFCLVTVSTQDICGEDDNDFIIDGGVLVKYTGSSSTVTIPAKVTQIGSGAFSGCGKLTEVTIPEGVTSIAYDVFDGCNNIKTVKYGGTLAQWCSVQNDFWLMYKASSVVLGDGTDLKTLTKLEIPEGVQCIGIYAFSSCKALESMVISDSVTEIREGAFSYCKGLKTVTISKNVSSIEKLMFCGCESLTSVTIPAGVTSIGSSVFNGCTSLKEVTIPNGVESIGFDAFFGCSKLTEIRIPNGVKSIEDATFQDCLRLAKVSIPASVKSIGRFAFSNCSANLVLYYDGTQSQWNAIEGIDSILLVKGTEIHGNDTTWSVK